MRIEEQGKPAESTNQQALMLPRDQKTGGAVVLLEDVHKTYGQREAAVQALRGITLRIEQRELLSVTGPSGCGKTTLLNLIGALDQPSRGRVTVAGIDLGTIPERGLHVVRRHSIGFVFQRFYLVPILSALENVLLPAMPLREGLSAYRDRAAALLQAVGLGNRLKHHPGQLSGGEQQRVAVARALLLDPPLVLADEPTGNLDSASGNGVLDLLVRLHRDDGRTVIIVTHDERVAAKTDRTIKMLDGKIEMDRRNYHTGIC